MAGRGCSSRGDCGPETSAAMSCRSGAAAHRWSRRLSHDMTTGRAMLGRSSRVARDVTRSTTCRGGGRRHRRAHLHPQVRIGAGDDEEPGHTPIRMALEVVDDRVQRGRDIKLSYPLAVPGCPRRCLARLIERKTSGPGIRQPPIALFRGRWCRDACRSRRHSEVKLWTSPSSRWRPCRISIHDRTLTRRRATSARPDA